MTWENCTLKLCYNITYSWYTVNQTYVSGAIAGNTIKNNIMKYLDHKVATVGIFFSAASVLIAYLLSIRWDIYISVSIFWLAIGITIATIIYQIFQVSNSPSYAKIVLLEIGVTCFILHMIYQIPNFGLVGSDVYRDLDTARQIMLSGWSTNVDPESVNQTWWFPMIHMWGDQISYITNIDIFNVAKWFPSLLDVGLIFLLYLFLRKVFQEEKVALLSVLLFSFLQHHILFSSLFIRESIGLVLGMGCFYLYFSARSSEHPFIYYALSILCLIGTVFAHHLTSFALAVFLFVHYAVGKISELSTIRHYFMDKLVGHKIAGAFVLVFFLTIFTYWLSVAVFPARDLAMFAQDIVGVERYGTRTYSDTANISADTLVTARGYLLYYGFFLFMAVFGAILAFQLWWARRRKPRLEIYSFSTYLFLLGLVGVGSLYIFYTSAYPDRFLMFAWLFGFAPLVVAVIESKRQVLQRFGILILAGFMIFNVYQISPTTWDVRADGENPAASREDYELARAFDFSTSFEGGIAAHRNNLMPICDVYHKQFGRIHDPFYRNFVISEYLWVIVSKESLKIEKRYYPEPRTETIARIYQLVEDGSPDRNHVFESNNLSVFLKR